MGHKEWFEAYLRVTGLTEKQAPVFAYLAYLYKQDLWVDYQYDHVIKKAARDSSPRTAANVLLWWPREKSIPKEFSYIDRRSVPELKVTNRRVIKYRLLDYGDMVVCDDVEGLHGRPNSGILGLMFRVIGEGKVDRCRYAVADDGSQVVQAQCSKGPAWLTTVATVRPDGEAISGVPDDREDLKALEKQLDRKLKTKYQPF